MAASFGDGASVRRLGQALLGAARELSSATGNLSGHVEGLVPFGWSGAPADRFAGDWNVKAGRARQLAAMCQHVGQVLTGLADQLDGAKWRTDPARAMGNTVFNAASLLGPGKILRDAAAPADVTGTVEAGGTGGADSRAGVRKAP